MGVNAKSQDDNKTQVEAKIQINTSTQVDANMHAHAKNGR
jgi:hypothetical protein